LDFPDTSMLGADDLERRDGAVHQVEQLAKKPFHAVTIEIGGVAVEARFEWPEAAAVYRRRYRHMLSTGAPRYFAHVAGWKAGEVYFWISGGATYVWLHSQVGANEVSFLMDAVVNTTVFNSTDGLIALHAGVVGDGASVAALVGTTTAGKSTTSIACARRGLDLYSDEFCLVTPRGVLPCPRSLNLREGGIELLARDSAPASPIDAWLLRNRGADRENVGFDDLFGEPRIPEPRPLRLAFIVAGVGPHPQAMPITPARMLVHVEPWARMKARGIDAAGALLALLRDVASYELTLGKPDDTARLIGEMLASARNDVKRIA
jgi:hypothetical protein